ncbi:hypothetical protein [Nocardia asiatica]|uniref:hypothetical protein n=1 Tax=Nocardia asiatica TaxID=209252 RepID=UPI002456A10F|nr:hypothetical protein [Nocardia asiatica]
MTEQLRIIDRALWVDHGDGNLDALTGELPVWADEWAERIVAAVNGQRVITEPNELPIGSIVLRDGNAWQRGKQCWWMAGTRAKWDKPHGSGPITALYVPTENGDTE